MKIHLFTSDNPPHEGVDVKAICGEKISKARLAFIFDVEFEGAANLNRLSICPKCYSTLSRARYICGAVNGQEAMTA